MKGKYAQKNFSAVGAMALTPLSLKTAGGRGDWGVSHTRTGPGRPPPPCIPCIMVSLGSLNLLNIEFAGGMGGGGGGRAYG